MPRHPLHLGIAAALMASACMSVGTAPGPQPPVHMPVRAGVRGMVRAVVISDLNSAYGSADYAAEVGHAVRLITGTWRPDFVLVAGDMVAGQSARLTDSTVRAMWQAFDSAVTVPLRRAHIPLVVTMGNHDASAYPAHARDRRIASEYWRGLPDPAAPMTAVDREHYPMRYTVRHGNVFVAAWDATNAESGTSEEFLHWLRGALASPQARQARHRVVLGHLPLYAVAEGREREGESLANGDSLRRQLEGWGATLFVSGHHHAYYPGRRGSIDLLHAGALGGGPRPLLGAGMPPRKTVSIVDFLPDSVAITTYAIGEAGGVVPIPLGSMPGVVCSRIGWVGRRDLGEAAPACGRQP